MSPFYNVRTRRKTQFKVYKFYITERTRHSAQKTGAKIQTPSHCITSITISLNTEHLPLTHLPVTDYTNVNGNRISRWQTYQQQLHQFWQRWSADYLQGLQQRQRWQRTLPNLQPGDLILSREVNTTPLQWPIAVITAVHPGKDGTVRVVTLRTPRGNFKSPISKICPLPRVKEE